MKYRKLGNTEENVSAIGLGTMSLSDIYGPTTSEKENLNLLYHALEIGINFWDTADIYGVDSANEILLSNILKENRKKVFLATKFGFRLKSGEYDGFQPNSTYIDGSPLYVKEAIENSLRRLKTDYIDLYYLHRVDKNTPIEETVTAMSKLVKEGKVRYIGLSECSADELKRAHNIYPISAVESEFSLLTRNALDEIIPLTKELGCTFIPFSPLSRGLVTGSLDIKGLEDNDFRNRLPRFQGEALDNNQKLAIEFALLARNKSCTPAQLALAWILAQDDHIIPIPGTKRIKYLDENAGAVNVKLNNEDMETIENILKKYPNTGARYSTNETKFIKTE